MFHVHQFSGAFKRTTNIKPMSNNPRIPAPMTATGQGNEAEVAEVGESGGTVGARRYTRLWNVADNAPTNGVKTVAVS